MAVGWKLLRITRRWCVIGEKFYFLARRKHRLAARDTSAIYYRTGWTTTTNNNFYEFLWWNRLVGSDGVIKQFAGGLEIFFLVNRFHFNQLRNLSNLVSLCRHLERRPKRDKNKHEYRSRWRPSDYCQSSCESLKHFSPRGKFLYL